LKKNYIRNPKGTNQWELRTKDEIQKIIDSYPQEWTKKDFRGEGSKNKKKILTKHETQREGLIFGTNGRHKKYKSGKLQCTICKVFKFEVDFPKDIQVESNGRRSNCKVCETKRYQQYINNMSQKKVKQMYKERHANLTNEQIKQKRIRDYEYRERKKNLPR
tara:strand:- start:2544 stop:3029 length:486 start_codon:yes stop_codon:yes gene_type:complete